MHLWMKSQTETPENINLSISNVAPQSPSSNSVISARLPKLELKHFNGNRTKFRSFQDSFESSVHHNSNLDNITKFNYLKSGLDCKASYANQEINLTSENYEHAICVLKERFGDPQVIIAARMDAL